MEGQSPTKGASLITSQGFMPTSMRQRRIQNKYHWD
jgi:hypothetical protein